MGQGLGAGDARLAPEVPAPGASTRIQLWGGRMPVSGGSLDTGCLAKSIRSPIHRQDDLLPVFDVRTSPCNMQSWVAFLSTRCFTPGRLQSALCRGGRGLVAAAKPLYNRVSVGYEDNVGASWDSALSY